MKEGEKEEEEEERGRGSNSGLRRLLLGQVVQALLRVLDQLLHGAVEGQGEAAYVVQVNQKVCGEKRTRKKTGVTN